MQGKKNLYATGKNPYIDSIYTLNRSMVITL